jgi:aspartate-semialdehyde dehydrogenase
MSSSSLRVGLAGATGAVGREILALIEASTLPVGTLVPMASPACRSHTVELGGEKLRVENLLAEHISTCDLVIFAVPPAAAAEPLAAALDEGVPVIDLSGSLGPEQGVPVVVPAVNRMQLQDFREHQAVASPRPEVVGLATLLGPLRAHAGDLRCRGTVMHSAASRGRAGIEELSNQVVSLFNSRTPQRKVFPAGLAFDLEPAIGEPTGSGWTPHELHCALGAAALLGLPPERLAVSALVGPWFNGLCYSLFLETDTGLDAERLERIYEAAPGMQLGGGAQGREIPRPRAADGSTLLQLGRLRDDPGGGVHLWAVADELRFGAAGNAVALLGALVEDGLL